MAQTCAKCGGPLTFIEGSGKWFCGQCGAYSTGSIKKGQSLPPPPPPPPEDSNVVEVEAQTIDSYTMERSGKGRLINAKCPNCGAMLELPEKLDRAFCQFCGGNVIIARDEIHHHYGAKAAIACPDCEGIGFHICSICGGSGGCSAKSPTPLSESQMQAKIYTEEASGITTRGYDFCYGGECASCLGKGTKGFGLIKCPICKGTGKCKICKGENKCECCHGKPKFKCEACNGTGFKVYEGG